MNHPDSTIPASLRKNMCSPVKASEFRAYGAEHVHANINEHVHERARARRYLSEISRRTLTHVFMIRKELKMPCQASERATQRASRPGSLTLGMAERTDRRSIKEASDRKKKSDASQGARRALPNKLKAT